MGYRRYRRERSDVDQLFRDTAQMANYFPWQWSALLGFSLFAVFYWALPAWIHHQLSALQGNMLRPIVEVIFAKRIHWLQWIGEGLLVVCLIFAVRNYFSMNMLDRRGEQNLGWLSRLIVRLID